MRIKEKDLTRKDHEVLQRLMIDGIRGMLGKAPLYESDLSPARAEALRKYNVAYNARRKLARTARKEAA
jgi:hypothetical protein